MATRSRIGLLLEDGTIESVYCHWDGYPEHNGRILQDHYDQTKLVALLALGDISSLAPEIGERHPFSQFDVPQDQRVNYDNWTTFYARDRGETGVGSKRHQTVSEFFDAADGCGAEYVYLMQHGVWRWDAVGAQGQRGRLGLLKDCLESIEAEEAV